MRIAGRDKFPFRYQLLSKEEIESSPLVEKVIDHITQTEDH